jgi:hypothetical protein
MNSGDKMMHVWCVRDQIGHIKPVETYLQGQAKFFYDNPDDPGRMLAAQPDIILCVNDYPYEITRCIDAARKAGIPSLVLQDGILEWRCQYENPLFGAGGGAPQHQPVVADKIACIGAQSARQIAAWGNTNKVEVTGMPRLDYLLKRDNVPVRTPGKRLLIMTAKKPGFTPQQTEIVTRSLQDVRDYLKKRSDIEVVWRITKGLDKKLKVENTLTQLASQELADVITQVDAVITTLSTSILETMLLQRPVAALDYHNVPRFVPTAWIISARDHIPEVINELLEPPARKLSFQQDCLHDCLRCDAVAAAQVGELITKMVAYAREAKCQQQPYVLAPNMLQLSPVMQPVHSQNYTLADLYPEQPLFTDTDVSSLQIRLARLHKQNEKLRQMLEQRGFRYSIYLLSRQLALYLTEKTRSMHRSRTARTQLQSDVHERSG